jgi:hypothetical protein
MPLGILGRGLFAGVRFSQPLAVPGLQNAVVGPGRPLHTSAVAQHFMSRAEKKRIDTLVKRGKLNLKEDGTPDEPIAVRVLTAMVVGGGSLCLVGGLTVPCFPLLQVHGCRRDIHTSTQKLGLVAKMVSNDLRPTGSCKH